MSVTVTTRAYAVSVNPDQETLHVVRVSGTNHRRTLDELEALQTMALWAPQAFAALAKEITALRLAALDKASPPVGDIRPFSTITRDHGVRVDIWVRRRGAPSSQVERVANAAYSCHHRRPLGRNQFGPHEPGWSCNYNGTTATTYFEADGEIVGWSPIPDFSPPE